MKWLLYILLGYSLVPDSGLWPLHNISRKPLPEISIVVLGIAQDAGYPQAGCTKACCNAYWQGKERKKLVTCLALVDRSTNQFWLFDATPDIAAQLHTLQNYLPEKNNYSPAGIFLTHAHIGHYTGLMHLGREVMNATAIPVWAMPRMDSFLRNNGPWNQLVQLKNIRLMPLHNDSTVTLNNALTVTPFLVPHRDEYSETVGYKISSSNKKILFIPDINKWQQWNKNIAGEIQQCDVAFIDGTFYQSGELPGRNMSEIPHPFVEETMQLLDHLPITEKNKIRFIHFNHTNPLIKNKSTAKNAVKAKGYGVAEEGMVISL
ncbi:MAG: pyrroloquinoline quinone biosynthesis protein PqqB [Bacteroidetes bacterium]|nr:pyrroloquinoline quinone biosynthesis protein PqqB [Bacteroidota bacterium]